MLPPEVCGCWLCCTLLCASSLVLTEFHISNMFSILAQRPSLTPHYNYGEHARTDISSIIYLTLKIFSQYQHCSSVVRTKLKATCTDPRFNLYHILPFIFLLINIFINIFSIYINFLKWSTNVNTLYIFKSTTLFGFIYQSKISFVRFGLICLGGYTMLWVSLICVIIDINKNYSVIIYCV